MRKAIVMMILTLGGMAHAAELRFLPAVTGPQKEFKSLLNTSPKDALMAWPQAFQGTSFAMSENGLALHAYLLAQNGLPISAIKLLVRQTTPEKISPQLLDLWKPILKDYVSELPHGMMIHASWKRLFPSPVRPMTKLAIVKKALLDAEKMSPDDPTQPALLFAVATNAPLFGDTATSLKAFQDLSTLKQNVVAQDELEMNWARVLYQKGDLDLALQHYEKIPKTSELWIESVEEKSWAYLRKNDPDKAVSQITTALTEPFAAVTGPESYFLSELISLKICDYPKILKTARLFKLRHKDRLVEMEKLAANGTNKSVPLVFADIDKKGLSIKTIGANIRFLPRTSLRDREFVTAMKYRADLLAENKKARDMMKNLDAIGGDADLERVLNENAADADQSKFQAVLRLKKLASDDLAEYKQIINKLHIVEAEVIQRLYVDETLKGQRKDLKTVKNEPDTLSFPYSDEVWLDELDHYRANVKNCPQLPSVKGASL